MLLAVELEILEEVQQNLVVEHQEVYLEPVEECMVEERSQLDHHSQLGLVEDVPEDLMVAVAADCSCVVEAVDDFVEEVEDRMGSQREEQENVQ